MSNRYSTYFLGHALWLKDDFCEYYLQYYRFGRQEILDVEHIVFFFKQDTEKWLVQCAKYDRCRTMRKLRRFLTDIFSGHYMVHRMNDQQVLLQAARQITRCSFQLVIKPRYGYAVSVNARTAEPKLPICVTAEPDLDAMLVELKTELDALVAEQQKNKDRINAQLAQMSETQRAAFYSKKAGTGLWEGTGQGLWDMVKAFPGFYVGHLKTLWKIAQTPGKMAMATSEAIMAGSTHPLKEEIDKIVNPVAKTYEQSRQLKSMLIILLSEPKVYNLLYDFAQRYYDVTHPAERTRMGVAGASDIILTVLLAVFTAGAGAAANIAAKAPRLLKIFKMLGKITSTLKKINLGPELPPISKKAASATTTTKKQTKSSTKKGVPEVEKLKPDVDKKGEKGYGDNNKGSGPKTTQKKLRKPPASLNEAMERLGEARKRLASDGFRPKYTDSQLKAMATKGEVNDRFVVRFMESKYAKGDGYLGPMNDGKVRYWSTTFDQIENADTDPKRISESLGLDYDPSKEYKLAVIDTADAAKYGDSHTIIPTHEKLGKFAASELKDIPQDKIPKVMNDGYSDQYARAMEIAKKDGVDIRDIDDLSEFSDNYFSNKDARELFKTRATIQKRLGANEHFTGNGLTSYTGKECGNAYGAVETFTFDKNPQTIGNMMSDGRMKLLDTSPVR